MKGLVLPLLAHDEGAQFQEGAQFTDAAFEPVVRSATRGGLYLRIGMMLFAASFMFDGFAEIAGADHPNTYGWLFLLYGIFSTAGLLIMTLADVEANVYLKYNKLPLMLFVVIWLTAYFVISLEKGELMYIYFVPNLPFLYLCVRWNQVTDMHKDYPKFTELAVMSLVFELLADGIYNIGTAHTRVGAGAYIVFGSLFLVGTAGMLLLAYLYAPWKGNSETLQFYMTLYFYIAVMGSAHAVVQLVLLLGYHLDGRDKPLLTTPALLFAPCHLVPAIVMWSYRETIHRMLGKRWLKERIRRHGGSVFTVEERSRGALQEVEATIANSALEGGGGVGGVDLNAYLGKAVSAPIPATVRGIHGYEGRERFTLLMYAAGNGHVASVRRLIGESEEEEAYSNSQHVSCRVAADKQSEGRRGLTAVSIAAREGCTECLRLLIQYGRGVNLNHVDADGFSPLYSASLNGHIGCVNLLLDHGAYGADITQVLLIDCAINRLCY
jgi:hypothetical protein